MRFRRDYIHGVTPISREIRSSDDFILNPYVFNSGILSRWNREGTEERRGKREARKERGRKEGKGRIMTVIPWNPFRRRVEGCMEGKFWRIGRERESEREREGER